MKAGSGWFFRRVRFTPFVGYLVGVNRHQDIRGTFVDVLRRRRRRGLRHGRQVLRVILGDQLGPTGGVLFGIGAVEAMIETQLRYVSALSTSNGLSRKV